MLMCWFPQKKNSQRRYSGQCCSNKKGFYLCFCKRYNQQVLSNLPIMVCGPLKPYCVHSMLMPSNAKFWLGCNLTKICHVGKPETLHYEIGICNWYFAPLRYSERYNYQKVKEKNVINKGKVSVNRG